MTQNHLTMEQLLAVRDGDRSDPGLVGAHRHVEDCQTCRSELDRLHQRTARLRALGELSSATDQFPAIKQRLAFERRHVRNRRFAFSGMAAAAALAIAFIGGDLFAPQNLDASAQLRSAMDRNAFLEETLNAWQPEARVVSSQTVVVVLELEDRIAEVDAMLERAADVRREERMKHQLELWQERVSLMTALVDVHVTRVANVDL